MTGWQKIGFFALGAVVGGATGYIGAITFIAERTWVVAVLTVTGTLLFGVLGIWLRERVIELFPWY